MSDGCFSIDGKVLSGVVCFLSALEVTVFGGDCFLGETRMTESSFCLTFVHFWGDTNFLCSSVAFLLEKTECLVKFEVFVGDFFPDRLNGK